MSAVVLPRTGVGQEFSGSYTAQPSKSGPKSNIRLIVVQDAEAIEFTRTVDGRSTKNRCPFSGSGIYTSEGGVQGTCTTKLKGNSVIVDSVVNTSTVRLHTRERWQLSKDLKILTISSQSDSPDMPGISAALGDTLSFTAKYTRDTGN